MIEFLRGKILESEEEHVLLDVQGVGYGLHVPRYAEADQPKPGDDAEYYVSTVVREDSITLYAFRSKSEKRVFDIFEHVSGIGPRTGLDILSTISVNEFITAVLGSRTDILVRVPGIGKKKAERIILDLKDRLKQFSVPEAELPPAPAGSEKKASPPAPQGDAYEDAVKAMQALGFSAAAASRNVAAAMRDMESDTPSVEEVVKAALRMTS